MPKTTQRTYNHCQVNKDFEAGEMTPEEQAREIIDDVLEAAGWKIQDYRNLDLSAGLGVAVREFPLKTGSEKS